MPASLHAQKNLQDNVPPIRPPCPTCGEAMRMVSVTSAKESVVYGYLCSSDHVFEFTIRGQVDHLSWRGREQEPSMDPESQEDRSTIEDRFAEQDVPRYSTWSSVVVIVGVMVVLALLYFFLR
jgi:hypothetical protein